MLLTFTLENWKSFKDRTEFSLEATKEKQHGQTLIDVKKYRIKVLPISAIFGGNASGKSNFVNALSFLQKIVIDPEKEGVSQDLTSFRLDAEKKQDPTFFEVELLLGGNIYIYSISLNGKKIFSEKLEILNSSSRKLIFEVDDGKFSAGSHYKKALPGGSDRFVLTGLEKSRPILHVLGDAGFESVSNVYNWFKKSLRIVTPDSVFINRAGEAAYPLDENFYGLGTGIKRVEEKDFTEEPPMHLQELVKKMGKGDSLLYRDKRVGVLRVVKTEDELSYKRLLTVHDSTEGKEEFFSFADESDGSIRLLDINPAFRQLKESSEPITYVIDELDRSLHSKLTCHLISDYLFHCTSNSNKQLIFTTHEVNLLDQEILRRDEMWLCNRKDDGSSELYPLNEFKEIRLDNNVRKSYLDGRMGGLPKLTASVCQIVHTETYFSTLFGTYVVPESYAFESFHAE